MGRSTSMRCTRQRMAGFHKMDSNTARAAEGVMTSYETRSTFISGRVKQAKGPATSRQNREDMGFLYKANPLGL